MIYLKLFNYGTHFKTYNKTLQALFDFNHLEKALIVTFLIFTLVRFIIAQNQNYLKGLKNDL